MIYSNPIQLDSPLLNRYSCQLLASNGTVSSARVYAESQDEAEQMLKASCYKYANLALSGDKVHFLQEKGIF